MRQIRGYQVRKASLRQGIVLLPRLICQPQRRNMRDDIGWVEERLSTRHYQVEYLLYAAACELSAYRSTMDKKHLLLVIVGIYKGLSNLGHG